MAFQKGQSGNPGGRPKESNDAKKYARKHGKEAIKKLAYWMNQGDGRVSVTAAQAILDRAYGKPAQAITGEGGGDIRVKMIKGDENL